MKTLIFRNGTIISEVRIIEKKIEYGFNGRYFNLDGMLRIIAKTNLNILLKNFPELSRLPKEEAEKIAIERIKKQVDECENEEKLKEWVINEMTQDGWILVD